MKSWTIEKGVKNLIHCLRKANSVNKTPPSSPESGMRICKYESVGPTEVHARSTPNKIPNTARIAK